jgi:GNAT superfamily N-acetyltransferase
VLDATALCAQALEVRRLRPSDRPRIEDELSRLSRDTLYRRFLRLVDASDVDVSWVQELDGPRHVAFGACLRATGEPLGLARAVVTGDEAEVAVTVIDRWQSRRVGTRLAQTLEQHLRAQGTAVMVATILAENRTAIALLRGLGARRSGPIEDGVIEMRLELLEPFAPPA